MQKIKYSLACLLCSLVLALTSGLAFADKPLPEIDHRYVTLKEINPTRDAGYVVGDVIDRTIIVTIRKPYELVKESLPIVGYEHRWRGAISGIELTKIDAKASPTQDGVTHTIHLSYQVFTTGRVAKPAALRAEILKIRNTQKSEMLQYRVPSFSIRVSPLSVFGQVKLREEMSPFVAPLHLDSSTDILHVKVLAAVLGFALLALLYIFGVNAWLPRMGAPFAKAYRDIRKLPDTPEGLQQAVTRLHQSINKTAGTAVFAHNINDLIALKPGFESVKTELEKFFTLSRFVFFEAQTHQHGIENPKAWLLRFCRHLRDCERGLRPDV